MRYQIKALMNYLIVLKIFNKNVKYFVQFIIIILMTLINIKINTRILILELDVYLKAIIRYNS